MALTKGKRVNSIGADCNQHAFVQRFMCANVGLLGNFTLRLCLHSIGELF